MRKNTFWCSFKHHQLTSGCPRQIALQSIYVNSSIAGCYMFTPTNLWIKSMVKWKETRQDMVVLIQWFWIKKVWVIILNLNGFLQN